MLPNPSSGVLPSGACAGSELVTYWIIASNKGTFDVLIVCNTCGLFAILTGLHCRGHTSVAPSPSTFWLMQLWWPCRSPAWSRMAPGPAGFHRGHIRWKPCTFHCLAACTSCFASLVWSSWHPEARLLHSKPDGDGTQHFACARASLRCASPERGRFLLFKSYCSCSCSALCCMHMSEPRAARALSENPPPCTTVLCRPHMHCIAETLKGEESARSAFTCRSPAVSVEVHSETSRLFGLAGPLSRTRWSCAVLLGAVSLLIYALGQTARAVIRTHLSTLCCRQSRADHHSSKFQSETFRQLGAPAWRCVLAGHRLSGWSTVFAAARHRPNLTCHEC